MRIVLSPRHLKEWADCDPTLRQIALDALSAYESEGAVEVRVTSLHRTEQEEKDAGGKSGIHVAGPPYRAIDLDVWSLGLRFEAALERITVGLNDKWDYDPARPGKYNVAYSKPHGSGPHLHLQVHTNTRLRG